ncbi:sigma-54 interaction domain-containing protein [Peribacillus asahii]|uniref:sigma-54 interaction domain-containing protein n=1 Tax=Peribacillus asahii TaxID=228899 RepID=UPI002079A6A7|nr:sigma 54-interacting transcriptional regulator [Peribacillus asahii]USK57943.1 sigma 54-interacting transcriptional regulator [Peribacillus asahii]
MTFLLPSVKEAVKYFLMDTSFGPFHIEQKNGEYYYRSTENEPELLCKIVYAEDDSLSTLIQAFRHHSTVVILDTNKNPIVCATAAQMINFLHNSYNQLKAFYETVIQTTDSLVTVVDDNGIVCTLTKGAEIMYSANYQEIVGSPITDFFDPKKLAIFQSLYEGKSTKGKYHQPRSDLFILLNTNPVYFNGQIIGAVSAVSDVTNQVVLNEKLFNLSNKLHRLEQEAAMYKNLSDPFQSIKGKSAVLQETVNLARKVCSVKSTVLILGESGVGKEVFAKAIHEASEEPSSPFISINCGAISASLFESELFGYERGAFSGADSKGKKGKIELAKGGTLFLDEVGEMPLDMQVKFLRVLQEQKFYRVGGEKEIKIDFRIIAATNRSLLDLMKEGMFREDLYYRLNVFSLHIPPLRERKEDIIELTHSFLSDFSLRYKRSFRKLSTDVVNELIQYDWPGNIRELRNVIERLVVLATDGVIKREYLPFPTNNTSIENHPEIEWSIPKDNDYSIVSLQEEMDKHEKEVIKRALQILDGNKVECAKQLGITRTTLYNRMKRLGMN